MRATNKQLIIVALNQPSNMLKKNTQKIFIILLTTIIIFLTTTFFLIKDKPKYYFDPQDPNNIYTITADDNYFYVKFTPNNSDHQPTFISIIASSPIDLHQFVNKKVNLNGKFIFTTFNQVIRPKNDFQPSKNKLQALEINYISPIDQNINP